MNFNTDDHLLRQSKSINPYLLAASFVYRRLLWDLSPVSWSSRKKIKLWKDKYTNQKAVILCNGPSLLKVDFSILSNVFTFGLNKINLLFDKNDFRPNCIVAINHLVLEQNRNFYNKTEIPLFLDSKCSKYIINRGNAVFLPSSQYRRFSTDCTMNIYHGYTVTFAAMQLAFYMGFSEVALVGCDHNFAVKGASNKEIVSGEKDESHFDPNYFAGGAKWQLPDLFESEVSYMMAKNMYAAHGRTLVNATDGGMLDIFPRKSLESFIEM